MQSYIHHHGLIVRCQDPTQSRLTRAYVSERIPLFKVENLKLQRLMLLKVVVQDERLLVVRVQIVIHHLSLVNLGPLMGGASLSLLRVESHHRVCLSNEVHIDKVAAGDEELNFEPRVIHRHDLGLLG